MRRVALFVCLLLALLPVAAQDVAPPDNRAAALDVLGKVNQWRLDEGLAPLKENPLLTQMAIEQASYVYPRLAQVAQAYTYHDDAKGRNAQARAVQLFGWATYNTPQQIEVGENAASGSVDYALRFWRSSDFHRRAALNPTYREVGVAALPSANGFLIYLVLGAQPNVLPALASADGTTLYLTNELSRYNTNKSAITVRLFDSQGRALTDEMEWAATMPIPENAGDEITVLYNVGDVQSISVVDLDQDLVILPGVNTVVQATIAPVPTLAPVTVPAVTSTFSATEVVSAPRATATPAPTSTPVPTATSQSNTMTLRVSANGLVLQNTSAVPLNITNLEIGNATAKVNMGAWTRFSSFNTGRFSSNDCLVTATYTTAPATDGCRYVLSSVQYSNERAFWQKADIEIYNNGVLVATCKKDEATCVISWQ
jgi:hypothetical protein